jgi:hypothetical protein
MDFCDTSYSIPSPSPSDVLIVMICKPHIHLLNCTQPALFVLTVPTHINAYNLAILILDDVSTLGVTTMHWMSIVYPLAFGSKFSTCECLARLTKQILPLYSFSHYSLLYYATLHPPYSWLVDNGISVTILQK